MARFRGRRAQQGVQGPGGERGPERRHPHRKSRRWLSEPASVLAAASMARSGKSNGLVAHPSAPNAEHRRPRIGGGGHAGRGADQHHDDEGQQDEQERGLGDGLRAEPGERRVRPVSAATVVAAGRDGAAAWGRAARAVEAPERPQDTDRSPVRSRERRQRGQEGGVDRAGRRRDRAPATASTSTPTAASTNARARTVTGDPGNPTAG